MKSNLPRHIAIIMDGNGRWAKKHRMARLSGHRKGADAVRDTVTNCRDLGVEYLTLYAFSEENWKRPALEIKGLMIYLKKFLISERGLLKRCDIRLRTIGEPSRLPKDVQKTLAETMALTQHHKSMTLILALSYGGRSEIVRSVKAIAEKVAHHQIKPSEITADAISQHLDTAEYPDPDLLIRTSGELRTSNFLPWQMVYTELYVTPTLWPDFSKEELYKAIEDYQKRERRFGLISEQLPEPNREGVKWQSAK